MRGRLMTWIAGLTALLTVGWIPGLIMAAFWCVRALVRWRRARAALAPATRCPRGHDVPQYGVFRCRCGAVSESWAWACPVCGEEAGWIACPECGLAVTNRLLG